jgi:hypothetical protein
VQCDGIQFAADEAASVRVGLFSGESPQGRHPLFHRPRRDRLFGVQRPATRSRPRRERKQVQVAEGESPHQIQRLLELGVCFAGEAYHYIRSQG